MNEEVSAKNVTLPIKDKTVKNDFFKELVSILPFVCLMVLSINIFIFYYLQAKEGVIFLHSLFLDSGKYIFNSGKYIYYSTAFVAIMFLYPLLKLSELDNRTKTFFKVYAIITSILLAGTPSEIYAKLFKGELPWSIYFIVEMSYELAAFYIIYLAIKNFSQKTVNTHSMLFER